MIRFAPPSTESLREAVHERARIDTRALATLRIALGVLLLVDLALRSRDLVAFYTDDGVVTRSVLAGTYPFHPNLSLHALSGDPWLQVLLFLLAGAAAVALTLGYRTRLATAVSFVLLVSLHARNPTVLNSGDVLLRRLVFWGILLPLGARWSVDARGADESRESVATIASLALLTQVVLVYGVNAVHKLDSELWLDGGAMGYVLHLERFNAFLGPTLAEFEPLLVALTWLWIVLLFCSWLLLVTTGWVRAALAVMLVAGHVGMFVTIDLGIFPLVSIAALLPFLPSALWDRFDAVDLPRPVDRVASGDSSTGTTGSLAPVRDQVRRARPAIHASFLILLLLSNAAALGVVDAPDGTPEELTDETWTMFAHPPTSDVWIVPVGHLTDNRTVDALRGGPPHFDRPPDVDRYPNARWRKHLNRYPAMPALRPALANYLCSQWNDGSEQSLDRVHLRRVRAPIEPGDPWGSDSARVTDLGRFRCEGEQSVRERSAGRRTSDR